MNISKILTILLLQSTTQAWYEEQIDETNNLMTEWNFKSHEQMYKKSHSDA